MGTRNRVFWQENFNPSHSESNRVVQLRFLENVVSHCCDLSPKRCSGESSPSGLRLSGLMLDLLRSIGISFLRNSKGFSPDIDKLAHPDMLWAARCQGILNGLTGIVFSSFTVAISGARPSPDCHRKRECSQGFLGWAADSAMTWTS